MPLSPAAIVERIAGLAAALPASTPARVAIDTPPWSGLDVTQGLAAALLSCGRTAYVVDVHDFLRPASVRLERGRGDADAFYEDWIDFAALRREVLDPLEPGGSHKILPTLWDVERDRATRSAYVDVAPAGVVVVVGWFLLSACLPFELTVHVALSPAARRRRVPAAAAARELPAWDRYDAEVSPTEIADLVVRADDPQHPAVIDRIGQGRR